MSNTVQLNSEVNAQYCAKRIAQCDSVRLEKTKAFLAVLIHVTFCSWFTVAKKVSWKVEFI